LTKFLTVEDSLQLAAGFFNYYKKLGITEYNLKAGGLLE